MGGISSSAEKGKLDAALLVLEESREPIARCTLLTIEENSLNLVPIDKLPVFLRKN